MPSVLSSKSVHNGQDKLQDKSTRKEAPKGHQTATKKLGDLEVYRDPEKLYLDIVRQVHKLKSHMSKYFSPEKDAQIKELYDNLDKLVTDLKPIALIAPQFDFEDIPVNGYRSLMRIWLVFLKSACKKHSERKLRSYVTALVAHLSAWPGLLVETASTSMTNNYDELVGRRQIIYFYSTFDNFIHTELLRPELLLKLLHPTLYPFVTMFLRVAVYCFEPSIKKKLIKSHYLTYNNTLKSLLKQLVTLKPEQSAKWIRSADWLVTQTLVKTVNNLHRPLGYAGINLTKRKVKVNCPNRFIIQLTEDKITLEDNSKNISSISDDTSALSGTGDEVILLSKKMPGNFTRTKVFILKSFSTRNDKNNEQIHFQNGSNRSQSNSKCNPVAKTHHVSLETANANNNLNNGHAEGKRTSKCSHLEKTSVKTTGLVKSKSRLCSFYTKLNANSKQVDGEKSNHLGENNNMNENEAVSSSDSSRERISSSNNGDTGKVLLYIHGGAFLGPKSSSLIEIFLKDWSSRLPGVTFLVPEYSYAPESTFPSAWQEMLNFYIWLVSAPRAEVNEKLGISIDPSKLVLAGDSSGGLLSSSLLVMLNEINTNFNPNIPVPRQVVLLFPKSSMRVEILPSALMSNYDLLLNGFVLLSVAEAVLPITIKDESTGQVKLISQEERRRLPNDWFKNCKYRVLDSPILSPLTYEKMDQLKHVNLNLLVVTFDPLLDDGVLFARKWKGSINFYVADDVCHGAFYYRQFAPCANQFNNQVLKILKNALDYL